MVQSVLLYGSEVWAEFLSKDVYCKCLVELQRREAQRVVSAYRAAPEPAVMVIAGVIPITFYAA